MEKEKHQQEDTTSFKELAETCTCMHVRKAARVITQLYDTLLQPSGLRATQLILLVTLALSEQKTVMQLAERLVMDRSALARSLKPLENQGLLTVEPGSDRRTRVVQLTEQGRHALRRALPSWRQAQEQVIAYFGEQQARLLLADLNAVGSLGVSTELLH